MFKSGIFLSEHLSLSATRPSLWRPTFVAHSSFLAKVLKLLFSAPFSRLLAALPLISEAGIGLRIKEATAKDVGRTTELIAMHLRLLFIPISHLPFPTQTILLNWRENCGFQSY